MIQPITMERWQEAQLAERKMHTFSYEEGLRHYLYVAGVYAKYLQLPVFKEDKIIFEIGPADFPISIFTRNQALLFEPMPSEILEIHLKNNPYHLWAVNTCPFEQCEGGNASEVWLLNVLQHVIDPEAMIAKAKSVAPVIRFFEPINQPTCSYHPHTFTEDDFRRWFGDCVKIYDDRVPYFFDDKCAYGVWNR